MEIIEIQPTHAAIVDAVCLMTVIDGILDAEELDFLLSTITTMLEVSPDVSEALIQNSLGRLKGADGEAFIHHIIQRLPLNEHRHMLLVALQLASLSDGILKNVEVALLEDFVERLDMSEDAIKAAMNEATEIYDRAIAFSEVVPN